MPTPATSPSARTAVPPTLRAQIDAYCEAGLHQRLPTTDARILPTRTTLDWDRLTPNANPADVTLAGRRRTPTPRAVLDTGWPEATATLSAVGPCPSAPGSSRHQRYEILKVGATIGELRDRGLRLSDLTRYLGSGAVSIGVSTTNAGGAE